MPAASRSVGEQLALGVDIGVDVVGDGAGIMADADAAVEGRVAEPDRPLLLALVQHLPEPHMMAVIGAFAVRLFEREILAPAEIEQSAHGRVACRGGRASTLPAISIEDRNVTGSAGNQPAAFIAHKTSFSSPISPTLIGIAGNALRGPRHHRQIGETLLVLVMGPDRRQHQIGQRAIGEDDGQREQQKALEPRTIRRAAGIPDRHKVVGHDARALYNIDFFESRST